MTLATSKSGIDTVQEMLEKNNVLMAKLTLTSPIDIETKHSFVSLLQIWTTKAMFVNSDVSYNELFIWQGSTVKKNYKR